ncbi:MAG: UbiA family prenyltransferase [Humidesulfovibrio sp.]|nr:UbiA family prenyltransferase [Humidesulfovibrio sp.]
MTPPSLPPSLLADLAALLRPRIGLLAGAGATAGCLFAGGIGLSAPCAAGAGAFLLSGGCSALNQVQERAEDARMVRTRSRPLPAGRLGVRAALGLALLCLALAALTLGHTPGGPAAALFVPLTVLVYNGVYTPLKKRSSLAMLLGGLAGALPPVVGYAASGASPLTPGALLLAGVFYAWQVPHFWLFARLNRADYAAAGFLTPLDGVARTRAPGALALWLVSYGALMLLIPAFGLMAQPLPKALVAGLAASVCLGAWPLLGRERLGFALVNASLVLFLCFLVADALRLTA